MAQSFNLPSSNQILQSLLQTYSAITSLYGYSVRTDPGSDVSLRYTGVAQQLAIIYQLMGTLVDSREPDTATGSDLDRVLNQFGLVRKPATSSEGFLVLSTSAPTTILTGALLSSQSNGLTYQVSSGAIYSNGQNVPIISVDQGQNTNLGAGETLQWINQPAFASPTAVVSVALTGGSDAETDSQARVRLYSTVQNPPGSGNASQLISISNNIDPIVQSAFVYSNFQGAGTQMIALTGFQSDGYYIGRDIPHLLSDNVINYGSSPYNSYSQNYGSNLSNDTSSIYGQLPIGVANNYASVITTVNNVPCDLTFSLSLSYPIGNPGGNGYGNGWYNYVGATWPNPDPAAYVSVCKVTAVTSSTSITVAACSASHFNTGANAGTYLCAPTNGLTKIQWIDRSGGTGTGWNVITATVLTATDNGNNTWSITLDTPLVCSGPADYYGHSEVAIGDTISPAALNAQNYVNTIMASFAILGPGQVTSNASLLSIGAGRVPTYAQAFPAAINASFAQALTSSNTEIQSAVKLYEYHTDGSSSGSPPNPASPVSIFIPRNLGWADQSI